MDSISYFFIIGQDLQDIVDFFSHTARRPSAEGRYILTILLILSTVFFKRLKYHKNGILDD
jgi:hypothetical protein